MIKWKEMHRSLGSRSHRRSRWLAWPQKCVATDSAVRNCVSSSVPVSKQQPSMLRPRICHCNSHTWNEILVERTKPFLCSPEKNCGDGGKEK